MARIVDIQLQRLEKRLTQQQLTLEVDRTAKQLIAKEGFDPQFGARPLKRAIQDRLLDPLATSSSTANSKQATASRWSPATAHWSSLRSEHRGWNEAPGAGASGSCISGRVDCLLPSCKPRVQLILVNNRKPLRLPLWFRRGLLMASLAAAIQATRWVSWSARQRAATRLDIVAHRHLRAGVRGFTQAWTSSHPLPETG